ncbi:vacuolar protein sorting-associated protein 8 homolog [Oscarella lobularis]|uniref:vacuolar protein sorting-associated protein 8 homolog n=1 Tax=Oscarella lobularis TaxID=121494 RepID=UPI0033137617
MATNLGVPIGDELRRSTENLHDVLSATGEIVEVGTTFVDENDAEASDSSSDLDLEFSPGLDEDEFDLPTLDTVPTLESILAEGSDEEDALKDILPGGGKLKEDAAAFDSRRKTLMPAPNKLSENVHGSVLKAVSLPNIGAQLDRTKAQLDSGFPTALAAGKVIAIGTSRGLVLVFEAKALKWVLGDAMQGGQYGAISATGFNTDSTRLICGYARGQLTMWDVVAGKLLRTITDAHPPGHAVLQVEFTDNLT